MRHPHQPNRANGFVDKSLTLSVRRNFLSQLIEINRYWQLIFPSRFFSWEHWFYANMANQETQKKKLCVAETDSFVTWCSKRLHWDINFYWLGFIFFPPRNHWVAMLPSKLFLSHRATFIKNGTRTEPTKRYTAMNVHKLWKVKINLFHEFFIIRIHM